MTTTKKPSSTEDEYFAREEAQRAKLNKLRHDQEQEEAEREARIGTCPGGCPTKLVEETFQTLKIDRCPTCKGVWLDPGELEQLASDSGNLLRAAFQFIAGKSEVKR